MSQPPSRDDDAELVLNKVRVGGRAASLYVYRDRLVITTDTEERTIPMGELQRVATRRWWRGARLLLALEHGEIVQVRRLESSKCRIAHRIIIDIARGEH